MDPILGQISIFAFGRIPEGWVPCDGRALSVSQYQALYALLGTQFGGDGKTYFNVPDLRGRVPVLYGLTSETKAGTNGGSETVALTISQIPQHNHMVQVVNSAGNKPVGLNNHLAASNNSANKLYVSATAAGEVVGLKPDSVSATGSGTASHSNMQPFITLSFCMAVTGVWPSRE